MRGERLDNIFKRMAGEGVRHKVRAGSQKHEDTPVVHAPDFLCGGNAVHAVHVNVHKNGIKTAACRKAAVPECLKEAFRIQEWDSFHMAVALCAKVADKPCHFVQIVLFIIY